MAKIQNEKIKNGHNWIPQPFQKSAEAIARDAVKQYVKSKSSNRTRQWTYGRCYHKGDGKST
jgi:hypothetical protein